MAKRRRKADTPEPAEPTHLFSTQVLNAGAGYTVEEVAWLKAVELEKKRAKKKFLTHVDYLRLAKSLGYTRAGDETTNTPPTGRK